MVQVYIFELIRLLYWIPLRKLVQIAPIGFSYRIAGAAGRLLYAVSKGKRERLEKGFRFLFGEGDYRDEIRKTFEIFALNSIEVFLYPTLSREKVMGMVEYEGLANIERALRKGRGAVLLHGHFGNEEFLMPAVGYLGYRVSQMASRWEPEIKEGFLYRFPNMVRRYAFKMRIKYRESLPVNFIYVDKGIVGAYKALKSNELLLLAADGREGATEIEADFLGRKALYSQGPMRLALRTGAEVLPIYLVRLENHRHRLIIEKPLELEVTMDTKRDVKVNTQKFVSLLGEYVKSYPSHYAKLFWLDTKYFKEFE